MPPCAATVCERVGKDFRDAGGPEPLFGHAERGAKARAARSHHDDVELVVNVGVGLAGCRGACICDCHELASESDLENGEHRQCADRDRRRRC